MLSQKLYLPAFSVAPRPWRFVAFFALLLVITQVVTPTQLDWMIPLSSSPTPVVESTAVVMSHQPEVVTDISDLWTWRAREAAVVEVEPLAPWDSTMTSAVVAPDSRLYHAELSVGRDSLAQFNDGAVSVFVEADTFASPTILEFLPIYQGGRADIDGLPVEETYFRFQIEAFDDVTGLQHATFDQPVRLVLDFDAIGVNLSEGYSELFLSYQDEHNPNIWHSVEFEVHPEANAINADLPHFSNWIAGERPSAWGLNWSPPTVSEFSGAVTYAYPIDVPPGRAGLQPSVALSYNSRNMDGHIRDTDEGFVADGWSIAQMGIFRDNVRTENPTSSLIPLIHPDRYSLVINGTGYDLRLAGGQSTANGTSKYDVLGNPSMLVKRHYSNAYKTYWTVSDGSGAVYTFGTTGESETWQCVDGTKMLIDYEGAPNRGMIQTCQHSAGSVTGWYLTEIEDVYGNRLVYNYVDNRAEALTDNDMLVNKKSRIANIYYNHKVTNTSVAGSQIAFRPASTEPIESIFVYHGGNESSSTPIGEYRLDLAKNQKEYSESCEYGHLPDDPKIGTTATLLKGITYYTNVDKNLGTNDGYHLPSTTFTYEWYYHHNDCFPFPYLKTYKNGYGAEVIYTYTSDNHSVGGFAEQPGYGNYSWPKIGYSYYVTKQEVNDGFGNADVRTEYNYQGRCYHQWEAGSTCYATNANDAPEYSALTGHDKTSITVHDLTRLSGDQQVSRTVYEFNTDHQALLGKTEKVTSGYPDSNVWQVDTGKIHQETVTTYKTITSLFRPVEWVTTTHKQGGASYSTATLYDYQTGSRQVQDHNNTLSIQLGQVTDITQYVNGDFHSLTRNWYRVKDNGNRRLIRQVMSGDFTSPVWSVANTIGYTVNLYDGINIGDLPNNLLGSDGQLTMQVRTMPKEGATCTHAGNTGCTSASQAIISTKAYDSYGNPTKQTSYAEYGYWTNMGAVVPTNGRTTTMTYDADLNIYPVQVENPLGHQTKFRFYGVPDINGLVPTGGSHLTGQLQQVVDANTLSSIYEYDQWARLTKVFTPRDLQDGVPSTIYTYNDTQFPMKIETQTRDGALPNQIQYFNGLGQLVQSTTVDMEVNGIDRHVVSHTKYDGLGRVVCQSIPVLTAGTVFNSAANCNNIVNTTTTYYAGRPGRTTVTAPDGNSTDTYQALTNRYGDTTPIGDGNQIYVYTAVEDAENRVKATITNALGQLVQVAELGPYNTTVPNSSGGTGANPVYALTDYAYDVQGNLTHVTDGAGNVSTMVYDTLGRKIEMNDPDMGNWFYKYDAAGNLKEQKDANGNRLCFYYDELDRIVHKTNAGTATACPMTAVTSGTNWLATYEYDTAANGVGQLAKVSWAPDGALNYETFSYDNLGRADVHTRVIDGRSYTMKTVEFDALNRPTRVEYPDGEIVTTTYDREGQDGLFVNGYQAANGTFVSGSQLVLDVLYNERGQMTKIDRISSAVDTDYVYYSAGSGSSGNGNFRLWEIRHGGFDDAVPNYKYEYDKVGNINQMWDRTHEGEQIMTFGYDHLYRLKTASTNLSLPSAPGYSETYSYDLIGNMTMRNGNSYSYDNNQPHAVDAVGSDQFTYDLNGNMTVREDGTDTYFQEYDTENRLIQVTKNGVDATVFRYDPSGQRTMSIEPAGTITYYPFPNYEESYEISSPNIYTTGFEGEETWVETGYGATWIQNVAGGNSPPHTGDKGHGISNHAWGHIGSPSISVNDNQSYTLEFWAKGALDTATGIGSGARATVQFLDNQDENIELRTVASGGVNSTNWTKFTATFTTPTDTSQIVVRLYNMYGSGWISYDDVSVTSSGGTAVYQTSFEGGDGWTETGYDATWFQNVAGGTSPPRSGSKGYGISNLAWGHIGSEPILVSGGQSYTLRFWAKGIADPVTSLGAGGRATVQFLDANDQNIEVRSVAGGGVNPTDWKEFTATFTAPSNTAKIVIRLYFMYGSGWISYDDVSLHLNSGNGGLVYESGFEGGKNWTETGYEATWFQNVAGGTSPPRSGSKGYGISNLAWGHVGSRQISADAGQSYTLSFWAKGALDATTSINGEARATVQFLDAEDQNIELRTVTSGGINSTDWTNFAATFTAPENTSKMVVRLYNMYGAGWISYDNVSLRLSSPRATTNIYETSFDGGGNWDETGYGATWIRNVAGGNSPPYTGDKGHGISNHAWGHIGSPSISVNGNQSYTLEFWAKGALDTATGIGSGARATVQFLENPDENIELRTVAGGGVNSTSWTKFTATFTTPADTSLIVIRLYNMYGSGWISYDDVSVTSSGGTDVYQTSFEGGDGWTETGYEATWFQNVAGGTSPPRSGSKGYGISNLAWGHIGSEQIPASGGQSYTLRFWAKGIADPVTSLGAGGRATVQFLDANDQNIEVRSVAGGGVNQTDWKEFTATFTAPSNTAKIVIRLYFMYGSGWISYDDVSLHLNSGNGGLVYESGFEGGENWTETGYEATWFQNVAGGTSPARSDSKGYGISNLAWGHIASEPILIDAERYYTLDFWAKGALNDTISLGATARATVQFLDADDQHIELRTVSSGGVDAANWKDFTATFSTPENAAKMIVRLYNMYGAGWISYDDVLVTQEPIVRKTYMLAGQPIATAVSGHADSNQNGLFYIYTDHLGSASTIADNNGNVVDTQRFLPFGELRTSPTTDITERGFTGHHENRDIGLTYMNARFYVPGIGRFASADTIVPDPVNPQAYNRYAYVYNNPMRFNDPSGHIACDSQYLENRDQGACNGSSGYITTDYSYLAWVIFYEYLQQAQNQAGYRANGETVYETPESFVAHVNDNLDGIYNPPNGMTSEEAAWWTLQMAGSIEDSVVTGYIQGMNDAAFRAKTNGQQQAQARSSQINRSCNSFAEGTLVQTSSGLIPIEEIEIGTYVLGYHENEGKIDFYPVIELISHVDLQVIYITIDDELIVTTAEHPFFTSDGTWVNAEDLAIGDSIRTSNWNVGEVVSIYTITQPQRMYNFTVDIAHTYFVGEQSWLVHNSTGPCQYWWNGDSRYTQKEQMQYHYDKHGRAYGWRNETEYTIAALQHSSQNWGYVHNRALGRRHGVTVTDVDLGNGSVGYRIRNSTFFGIYSSDGQIVTFGVR